MAYDTRTAHRSRVAVQIDHESLGLGGERRGHIVTGGVVAVAVMIVALIAVLMGMA